MAIKKIMILGETGGGKSTSIGNQDEPKLGIKIKGLDPYKTYVISATEKNLPWRGSDRSFPKTTPELLLTGQDTKGRRIVTTEGYIAANCILYLSTIPVIETIILDDSNYYMQDYYMANALKTGWDAPKKMGHFMGKIFDAMEVAVSRGKNFIMMAHWETYKRDSNGNLCYRMKTVGNMVADYSTPEGKFEIVLFADRKINPTTKKVERFFITNDDGEHSVAKSPPGMLEQEEPNDLGIIFDKVDKYFEEDIIVDQE